MDLNGDGNLDVLSGSYSRMDDDKSMAGLFQVLWGEGNGKFSEPKVLNGTDDEPLIAVDPKFEEIEEEKASDEELDQFYQVMGDSFCTRPTAADLNGDGKLDLVVGNASGTFYLFLGEGKGKFPPNGKKLMDPNGNPLSVSDTSDPCVVDWDQDGDLDILSGSSQGGVALSINSGTKSKPEFQPFAELIATSNSGYGEMKLGDSHIKGPQGSTRVWAEDLNGDGKLDVVVGDSFNLSFPAEGLEEDEVAKKLAQWQKKMAKFQEEQQPLQEELFSKLEKMGMPKNAEEEEAMDKIENEIDALMEKSQPLYEERDKIVREEYSGSVWVYFQKPNGKASKPKVEGQTIAEFKKYVSGKLGQLNEKQLKAIAEGVDVNSDGVISDEEFENRMEIVQEVLSGGARRSTDF